MFPDSVGGNTDAEEESEEGAENLLLNAGIGIRAQWGAWTGFVSREFEFKGASCHLYLRVVSEYRGSSFHVCLTFHLRNL